MCLKSNLFFTILRSNCRINNIKIRNLMFLRFSKTMILTAKNTLLHSNKENSNVRFLWLNKEVKYQSKPLLIEEFFDAGIYDFHQLLKPDGNLSTYDETAMTFRLNANNYSFNKFIKLTAAIPINWIEERFRSGEQNFLTFEETIFKQINEFGNSNKKKCTIFYYRRQKFGLSNIKINGVIFYNWILARLIAWSKVYENNYFVTLETKLRSFQIRLIPCLLACLHDQNKSGKVGPLKSHFCFDHVNRLYIIKTKVTFLEGRLFSSQSKLLVVRGHYH